MATIMSTTNSEGQRRCDETCHDAKSEACSCICEGRYHGKGDQAGKLLAKDVKAGVFGKGVTEADALLNREGDPVPELTAARTKKALALLEAGETRAVVADKAGLSRHQVWKIAFDNGYVVPRKEEVVEA